MKTILRTLPAALAVAALLPLASGCLVEEKIIELVLTGETSVEFSYDDTDEIFEDTAVIQLGDKIDDILTGANLGRDEVGSAHVSGVDYEVLSFEGSHDWLISGAIEVDRDGGGFVSLLDYTSQSVQEALGVRQGAPLTAAGVDLINQALADFLEGQSPVLTLRVANGDVEPDPSQGDPITFSWRVTLMLQVTAEQTLDVPQLF
jgi:hypothetical protein